MKVVYVDEIEYLRINYCRYSNSKLAKKLGWEKSEVGFVLGKLGLVRTDKEKSLLQKNKEEAPLFQGKRTIPFVFSAQQLSLKEHLYFTMVFVLGFLWYLLWLSDSSNSVYSTDFVICVADGGIPLDLASPLYLLFCKIAVFLLPLGDIAWRIKIMSALLIAVSSWLFAHIIYRLSHEVWLSVLGAGIFTFSLAATQIATTINPSCLATMLLLLFIYFTILWNESRTEKHLLFAALSLASLIASHTIFVFLLPAIFVFLYISHKKYQIPMRNIILVSIILLLGCNVFLWYPLYRWTAPTTNQANVDSISELWKYIASDFWYSFSGFTGSNFTTQINLFFNYLFPVSANILWLIPIVFTGIFFVVIGFRKIPEDKKNLSLLFLFILLSYSCFLVYSLFLQIPPDGFLKLHYLMFPLTATLFIFIVFSFYHLKSKSLFLLAGLIVCLCSFNSIYFSKQNRAIVSKYCQNILQNVKNPAVIVTDNLLYWDLLYHNQRAEIVLINAEQEKASRNYITKVFEQYRSHNIYTTNFSLQKELTTLKSIRQGLLWQIVSRISPAESQDFPYIAIFSDKMFRTEKENKILSQYFFLEMLYYMDLSKIKTVLQLSQKCQEHQQEVVDKLIEFAQEYIQKKDFVSALEVYSFLYQQHPERYDFLLIISRIHKVTGNLVDAEKCLLDVLAVSPYHFYANIELADLYEKQQRLAEAEKIYETLIKEYPQESYPYKKLAQIKRKQGKTEEEASLLEKAQNADRETPEIKDSQHKHWHPSIPKIDHMLPKLPEIPTPDTMFPEIPKVNLPKNNKR